MAAAGLDVLTNSMPPKWDPVSYVDMARNGILGNGNLVAPFAYSFALPLSAGALARTLDMPVQAGFLWLTRLAGVFSVRGLPAGPALDRPRPSLDIRRLRRLLGHARENAPARAHID